MATGLLLAQWQKLPARLLDQGYLQKLFMQPVNITVLQQ